MRSFWHLCLFSLLLAILPGRASSNPEATTHSACNHRSPLTPGIPGSPQNLIQLPNRDPGVSELAALMRRMLEDLQKQRKVLEEQPSGTQHKSLPELINFQRISCAWPTDQRTRTEIFDAYAVRMNESLARHEDAQTRASYTRVVHTCLACHQKYCRGPIRAIENLYLTKHPASLHTPDDGTRCDQPGAL